nr:hypothetical protein [Tanacetum cinerariifolium]
MHTVRKDSLVEEVPTPQLISRKKSQKMTVRNDEEARCISWATKEEVAPCKGWVYVSEYSVVAEDNEEEEVKEVQLTMGSDRAKKKATASSTSSSYCNEEALARLMVFEYAMLNESYLTTEKQDCTEFLEIRRHELELKL